MTQTRRTEVAPDATREPASARGPVRAVTAAALFDGHDASINIMRRLLQAQGAEVVHLGHDRSVEDVVTAALQEDADVVAVSSYQGGHVEFFGYLVDRLREAGAGHIRVYGGGGGVISPDEVRALEAKGVTKIFRPEDGQKIGLAGMIGQMLESGLARPEVRPEEEIARLSAESTTSVARLISFFESPGGTGEPALEALRRRLESRRRGAPAPVIGFTGTGGAGKSSLVDELVRRFTLAYPERSVGVLSVDPTRRRSGGALLGDRLRMNAIRSPQVFMRSLATRRAHLALSGAVADGVRVLQAANFDLILVETAGIGQSDSEIVDRVDLSVYVMTPEYGAPSQLEKIDMLELADAVVLNKFDRRGGEDALRDVKKQWRRNHPDRAAAPDAEVPVYASIASRWNDPGTDRVFAELIGLLAGRGFAGFAAPAARAWRLPEAMPLVPAERTRYLAEIAETVRGYRARVERDAAAARRAFGLAEALRALGDRVPEMAHPYEAAALRDGASAEILALRRHYDAALGALSADARGELARWPETRRALHRRGAELRGARPRHPGAQPRRHPVGARAPAGRDPARRGVGRARALHGARERARPLPVHRGRVPVQAHRRGGPGAHVRRRGPARAHQPALPPARQGAARGAALDRVRQRHPVRARSRRTARHLRQGRHVGRLDLHRRRRGEALLWLRPARVEHVRVDDDQRPRAGRAGALLQRRRRPGRRGAPRRDRPARAREARARRARRPPEVRGPAARRPRRPRPGAARRVGRPGSSTARPTRGSAARRWPACAAPCRPTSSRRTRPRTPASSRPSSR